MEGNLQDFCQVEVPCEDKRLFPERSGFYTPRGPPPGAGILDGLTLADQLLHDRIGIEYRRLSEPGFHDIQGAPADC